MGVGGLDFFSFWFPIVSFMMFCKTIPLIYVEKKTILNKLLIFQKNSVGAVDQRKQSPQEAIRQLEYCEVNNFIDYQYFIGQKN